MPKPKSVRTKISRSSKSKTAVRKSEAQSKVRSSIAARHLDSKQARLLRCCERHRVRRLQR
jgi:hypothetical protein